RLAARIEQRSGGARALVDRAERDGIAALLRGLIGLRLRRRSGALGDLHELAELARFLLLRCGFAKRARLFVRELFDLSSDLGAERAATTIERFELAHVARDLAFEA